MTANARVRPGASPSNPHSKPSSNAFFPDGPFDPPRPQTLHKLSSMRLRTIASGKKPKRCVYDASKMRAVGPTSRTSDTLKLLEVAATSVGTDVPIRP